MIITPRHHGWLRVWDAPTRIFHWATVILIAAAWWTEKQRMLQAHRLIGYALFSLVLFRFAWALIGSSTSRFSAILRSPAVVYNYARHELFRRDAEHHAGHNPVGGWSIGAMLLVLLAQIVSGLVAVDVDGLESGPLSYLVSFEIGRLASRLHAQTFDILLALICLHVAAVAFHMLYKRDNLVMPMLSGLRRWESERPSLRFAPLSRALAAFIACALIVWVLVNVVGRV